MVAVRHICGPSGSGLTRALEQLYRDTPGAAMLTSDPRAHITFLRSTVAEELAFGLEQRGIAPEIMRQRVAEIAQALGLSGLLERTPTALSGGQTRRLAIGAVAIIGAPTLLLDDPFSGLDIAAQKLLEDMLRSYPGEVIIASHRPWLDAPTTYLGAAEELRLPLQVEGERAAVEFSSVLGTRGHAHRKWWQFSKPAPQFTVGPVDLTVLTGEVLWLKGANGSGKSTLMRALANFPDTSLMLQDPVDQVIDSTVSSWIPGSDCEEHPLDLSQRDLRLAQCDAALAANPTVLLVDEPDVGLDTGGRSALHHKFAQFLSHGAIILCCHDASFITEMSTYTQVKEQEISEL